VDKGAIDPRAPDRAAMTMDSVISNMSSSERRPLASSDASAEPSQQVVAPYDAHQQAAIGQPGEAFVERVWLGNMPVRAGVGGRW
jgi:hypothetical protein